jgi:hypothetical protein
VIRLASEGSSTASTPTAAWFSGFSKSIQA